jgi:ribonuclease P/MRP protein subunit RPP1
MHASENGCLKFCDLNLLQRESEEDNISLLQQSAKLGYQCVAFNTEVTLETKGSLPPVVKFDTKKVPNVKVLYRLTVATGDVAVLHGLSNPVALGYDILAITPLSDKVFLQACSSLAVDVISVRTRERLDFYMKRHQVKMAIDRGVAFEVSYCHLIRGESERCYTIANAKELVQWTKGKSTIVSSGTNLIMELRGPYDVANLTQLFGLKGGDCKAAILSNCRSVISHADMRLHTAKGIVSSKQVGMATESRMETDKTTKTNSSTGATDTKTATTTQSTSKVTLSPEEEMQT